MNAPGICRSNDFAVNFIYLLSRTLVHLHGDGLEAGMQSMTKEQYNQKNNREEENSYNCGL